MPAIRRKAPKMFGQARSKLGSLLLWRPRRLAAIAILVACMAAVALIGIGDFTMGGKHEIAAAYVLPVMLAAWFIGGYAALVTATASLAAWLSAHILPEQAPPDWWALAFNGTVKFSVWLLVIGMALTLRRALLQVNALARTDALTGLANRREFYARGKVDIAHAARYGHVISMIAIDLDNFKHVNDTHGHLVGDRLLRTVGHALLSCIRESDLAGRLGGDEFAVLMPETGADEARIAAAKIQARVLKHMRRSNWPVTLSVGVATFAKPPGTLEEILDGADALMYAAKAEGKNKVRDGVLGSDHAAS